jgi:glycosyltransferase involved in cell wall biosynthesis
MVLSIITPVYNGEEHIEKCIKNVLNQDCHLLDHCIIDGGSTDRTVGIIRNYANRYPHIRWISEKDQGQSDAMNKGVSMAKGSVLGFLNVDDDYGSGVLNKVIDMFAKFSEPTILVGNCSVWDEGGELFYVNKPKNMSFYQLLLGFDINPFPVNSSAYFYHKVIHDLIGMYDVKNHFAMDLDVILRILKSSKVQYVDENFGNFRLNKNSKTYLQRAQSADVDNMELVFNSHISRMPFYWRFALIAHKLLIKRERQISYHVNRCVKKILGL